MNLENQKFTNKKRKNDNNQLSSCIDEDYNIYYDRDNSHLINENNKGDFEGINEIIDVEFLFSEMRNTYYFGVKHFLEGLLDFDEFNGGELADLIIEEGDYIGTVIKTELEEDTGNDLPDLYSLTTLIPYDLFSKNKALNQIIKFCAKKSSNQLKEFLEATYLYNSLEYSSSLNPNIKDAISKTRLGLFINERVSNLPQQLIAPMLNLLNNDIKQYKEVNDNNPKYDVTHILYITK